jgi:hypothetical protein
MMIECIYRLVIHRKEQKNGNEGETLSLVRSSQPDDYLLTVRRDDLDAR